MEPLKKDMMFFNSLGFKRQAIDFPSPSLEEEGEAFKRSIN